jgi:hypothetical protein
MTNIPLAVLENYRKDLAWKPGHGYGRNIGTDARPIWVAERTGGVGSLIVHTTNGNAGSTLRGECEFIRDSPLVGIHDEIGHDGTLAEILPGHMVAWHSGATIPGFSNNQSYGIELHNAVSEQLTPVQIATLTWRVKSLIAEHGIPKNRIDTHRAVAVPPGRKTDPSDWTDASFYQWRDSLYTDTPVPHPKTIYLRTTYRANLRTSPDIRVRPTNVVKLLPAGDVAGYDVVPTIGQPVGGDPHWFHRADQLGFVHASILEAA